VADLRPYLLVHDEIVTIKNSRSRVHLAGIAPAKKPRIAI
jgi:hypothetical protein